MKARQSANAPQTEESHVTHEELEKEEAKKRACEGWKEIYDDLHNHPPDVEYAE